MDMLLKFLNWTIFRLPSIVFFLGAPYTCYDNLITYKNNNNNNSGCLYLVDSASTK